MTYDAIVIGGGIVGMSTAYHLVCNGAKTLLIDRKNTGRATDAGAGILSPATNTRDPDPWLRLGAPAFEYYPILIENLQAEQDGETGFATCGKMLVAVSDDEIEPFAFARQQIFNRRNHCGEPASEDLYEISSEEARSRFPLLADVHGAIYYREAARVDGAVSVEVYNRVSVRHLRYLELCGQGAGVQGVDDGGALPRTVDGVTLLQGAHVDRAGGQVDPGVVFQVDKSAVRLDGDVVEAGGHVGYGDGVGPAAG